MTTASQQAWQRADALFRQDRRAEARAGFESLLGDPDWVLPVQLRLSAIASADGRLCDATAAALAAFAVREPDPVLLEALARRLVEVGELESAVACATDAALATCDDPAVLAGTGELLLDQALPAKALPLLLRARHLGARGPKLDYLLGLARLQAGDPEGAERHLLACVAAAPAAGAAWRELARLRRQTPDHNHLETMRAALAGMPDGHPDAPPLHYALFKTLDDLGETEAAWAALEAGMRARRAQLDWNEAEAIALHEALLDTPVATRGTHRDDDGPQPVFIVGLPRSGTTLLERMLGAHPDLADAGELRDFGAQLRWMTGLPGPNTPDVGLMLAAEDIDHAELGRRYLAHTRWHADGRRFYTDKLPANALLVGVIARALPAAKFIHVARAPMDACFSNLKELFGEAYPHSYDQGEMARHWLRHRELMAHWREAFPGRIHDVSYEALVADPEGVARGVFAHLGLAFDPSAVAVDQRAGAVATASTAQVREPIHGRFVGQWRRYADHLGPTRRILEQAGIP